MRRQTQEERPTGSTTYTGRNTTQASSRTGRSVYADLFIAIEPVKHFSRFAR